MKSTDTSPPTGRRRANGWPVLPLRVFLAALFLFAGYAKLVYPRFFDPNSIGGFASSVRAAKSGTPLGGVLGPLADHPSAFGHITAIAEIAIGLGLLVGLLTRIAALGGIVLMASIVLSIDWGGVKEYTGSSGWFTSVDLAVGAALSVFLLGGADPFSLDALIWRARQRDRARDDDEPGFRDNEYEESRRRLQAHPDDETGRSGVGVDSRWNDDRVPERDRLDAGATRYDGRPDQDRLSDTSRIEPVPAEERDRR